MSMCTTLATRPWDLKQLSGLTGSFSGALRHLPSHWKLHHWLAGVLLSTLADLLPLKLSRLAGSVCTIHRRRAHHVFSALANHPSVVNLSMRAGNGCGALLHHPPHWKQFRRFVEAVLGTLAGPSLAIKLSRATGRPRGALFCRLAHWQELRGLVGHTLSALAWHPLARKLIRLNRCLCDSVELDCGMCSVLAFTLGHLKQGGRLTVRVCSAHPSCCG
mmetsp:Transcript_48838/g.139795  ORF Transcript_48838/g.139795 Transcript_48838/m.139795 type:complete len:218 (+) Transcript_48838:2346-2999(+)